ncbi:MAG TPA: flagellin [Oculatellaceae cyanobacterium]
MGLYLNSSQSALNVLRYLNINTSALNKSLERLASGYKINRAADNAASLMISESLRTQIRGYDAASNNSLQGLSMLQTADGALQQINEHLQRIREIAVAASNSTNGPDQFAAYQAELQGHIESIHSIASGTKYNDLTLLDGSISGGSAFNIQLGPNSGDTLDIKAAFSNAAVGASGIGAINNTLTSTTDANTILGQVDSALTTLGTKLATIGQYENVLENQMNYLAIAKENVMASESAIRNTDVAWELSLMARHQLLQQASLYALSQTNTSAALASRLLQ